MLVRYRSGDKSVKIDCVCFTVLIKACAHSHEDQALSLALLAMETLESKEFDAPNDVAYATLVIAIRRLATGSQKEELLRDTFRKCADRGLVSNRVIFELRNCEIQLQGLDFGPGNQLDPRWSRNVHPGDKPQALLKGR